MKIMLSSCLVGKNVMYYGGNFLNEFLQRIIDHPEVQIIHFCPEDVVLGTPRNNMLIHDGDGRDVLSGIAQIIDTEGAVCTDTMLVGANKMLEFAQSARPDLILLTEGSDSCGSNIILDPKTQENGKYAFKKGMGLAAALLIKHGFKVIGHFNEREIFETLKEKLNELPDLENLRNVDEHNFYPK